MKLFIGGFLIASQLLAASLHAQLHIWNNPGVGDWFLPGNWSSGVPISTEFAYISNGGTAQISAPGANVRALFLGGLVLGGVGRLRIFNTGFLTALEDIWVGSSGVGEMTLSSGGRVSSSGGKIGASGGGNGSVTITGPGSRWDLTDHLSVGAQGTGTLDILNGGVVSSSGDVSIAYEGNATVRVRDSGSSLILGDWLNVGGTGSGYLEIANGGFVSSGDGSVGDARIRPPFGPSSSVLVTGTGSRWNTGSLSIGSASGQRASLTVENGGTVQTTGLKLNPSGSLVFGANASLTGSLTIYGGSVSTLAAVTLNNTVYLRANLGGTVQFINSGAGATLHGVISGDAGLIKAGLPGVGEGPLTLTANNTYTGPTLIDQGALIVRGTNVSATTVNDGGTLAGTGTVAAVQVNSGGALEPGILDSGFGTLSASAVSFASGGIFRWEMHSNTGAVDRLVILTGGISINTNATFAVMDFGNAALPGAQSFTVIDKQSAGFARGNFAGYAEGARFNLGANRFKMSYRGGDGNDVTLTTVVPLLWNSGGTSDDWSDGGNWTANQAPVNGDSLLFGSGARIHPVMDSVALSVEEVTFLGGAPAFTLHVPERPTQAQLTITDALTNAGGIEQTLVAEGATGPGTNGGVLTIASNSLTGAFALIARGATGGGASGGVIEFTGAADAASVRVITGPGSYFDFSARVGALRLGSIEGGGLFLMGGNSLTVGFDGTNTEFSGVLAGGATAGLEKVGTGTLILSESNTYGGGTLISDGTVEVRAPSYGLGLGDVSIRPGAALIYAQNAVGDFQTVTAHGSASVGQAGGLLHFTDAASAGRFTMVVEGAAQGFDASRIIFDESSNAGTSTTIAVQPGFGPNGTAGLVTFTGGTTATGTTITNGGLTEFLENATAGSATITNLGAAVAFGSPGQTTFQASSTAGSAIIVNEAGTASNKFGGKTFIASDAGSAQITALGSAFPGAQGQVTFAGGSAAQSTVTAGGASAAGGSGGVVLFAGPSTAADSTLLAQSGLVPGATGGLIVFMSASSGGLARATIEAGAGFDISSLSVPSLTIGSIEGAGAVFLGSKELIVGGNDASTTFSGLITNGGEVGGTGGSLTKVGTGALTLAGINIYSGTTTIREGTLNLDTPLTLAAAILSTGGVLNVNASINGSSLVVDPAIDGALVNITVSQQLASLDIGDGGVVTLGAQLPAPLAASAVPEPGVGALLFAGVLGLLGRRRARSGAFPTADGSGAAQRQTSRTRGAPRVWLGRWLPFRQAQGPESIEGGNHRFLSRPPLNEPFPCLRKIPRSRMIRFSRAIRM